MAEAITPPLPEYEPPCAICGAVVAPFGLRRAEVRRPISLGDYHWACSEAHLAKIEAREAAAAAPADAPGDPAPMQGVLL